MTITRDMLRGPSEPTSLVGREQELCELEQAFKRARDGSGGLVLVSGQAGIGKTTLIRSLMTHALDQDAIVLEGCCYDLSTSAPYSLWLDMSDRYQASGDLPEMPVVLRRGTGVGELESQMALFDVAREFCESLTSYGPVVLILEDLHWADQSSLDLLRYLSRHLERIGMLVIASYRDDEVSRHHPLYMLLPSMIRESNATRIELTQLDRGNVQVLVRATWNLSGEDESRLVDHLMQYAEGNPLFTLELLRTLVHSGFLRQSNQGVALKSLSDVPVPALAEQVIDRRLQRISNEARHYLEIAAVIGHEVRLDVWGRVSGLSEEDLLSVVDQAIDIGVLYPSTDGRTARFDHALTREALYRGILAPRRRIWHRLIAEELENSADWIPDTIAYHYQQAGDLKAVDWLIQAGEWAQRTFAWRIAVDRFRTASEMLEQSGTRTREQGWLRYRSARLSVYLDPAGGAWEMDKAIQIASETGDAVLHAASLVRRGHLLMLAGNESRGIDELERGQAAWDELTLEEKLNCEYREIIGADPYVNVFRGTYLLMLGLRGSYRDCLDQAEDFITEMEAARERLIANRVIYWLDGYVGIGAAYAATGNAARARTLLESAAEGFNAINVPAMESLSLLGLLRWVHIPYETDHVAERRKIIGEIDDAWNRASGGIRPEMSATLNRILLLYLEGEWGEVNTLTEHGLDWHANSQRQIELMVTRAHVARHQGNPEVAWDQIRLALPNRTSSEPGQGRHFNEEVELASLAAELELDAGNLESARNWLELRDSWLTSTGSLRGVADGKLLWARYKLESGNAAAAKQLANEALRLASEPRQPWSLIAIHRFLGDLGTANGELEKAQAHLDSATRLANACEIPFERARTLVSSAELAIATGDHESANKLLQKAREIAESLRTHPTLERIDALSTRRRAKETTNPFGLTARELDVLTLLIAGKTDREIADELFISHHTAMRHVSSIRQKLDVSSRTAAASVAVREGLIPSERASA